MLVRTVSRIRGLLRDDTGQDVIEYALLGFLISVAAIGALSSAETIIAGLWSDIADGIASVL